MKIVFWLCIFLLGYVYLGYMLALKLCLVLAKIVEQNNAKWVNSRFQPTISAIICAFNQEKVIAKRIQNFLSQDYPHTKIEIIVASDGSTDRTGQAIEPHEKPHVRVLEFKKNRGRAAVHNDAVSVAKGEILVFSDAETMCNTDFLRRISAPFADSTVGCAVGNLFYANKDTGISASEHAYWKFEKKLRNLESRLGLLATGTGACMAVRRDLYRPLSPIDDCDFATPLDVLLQGFRVVYVQEAVAHDTVASTIIEEFRTRVRQTSKNLLGTLKRWAGRSWLLRPGVSWSLLSHKILRWLTPFLLAGVLISNFFLLDELFYACTFALQLMFYFVGALGLIADRLGKQIPVVSGITSFCVACLGMALGVVKALTGHAPAAYTAAGQTH